MIRLAYDAGVNFFDNAEAYAAGESERLMGRALEKLGLRRDTHGVPALRPSFDQRAALGDPIALRTTRRYQTYYRDPNLTFCPTPPGSSFNVSNGVVIAW